HGEPQSGPSVPPASFLPIAFLDSYEVDISNTPSTQWLPTSLTLLRWDFFNPIPKHSVGQCKIDHLRLLTVVVQHSDLIPVIQQVARLLNPGGYIQWEHPETHVKKTDPTLATPAFDRLRKFVYTSGRHDWELQLLMLQTQNEIAEPQVKNIQDRVDLGTTNGARHVPNSPVGPRGGGSDREGERR
ncbi:hypothetical protein F1880_004790, partial [Penicillium rolfsii]